MDTRYWLGGALCTLVLAAPVSFANTAQTMPPPTLMERLQLSFPNVHLIEVQKHGGQAHGGRGSGRAHGGGQRMRQSPGGHRVHSNNPRRVYHGGQYRARQPGINTRYYYGNKHRYHNRYDRGVSIYWGWPGYYNYYNPYYYGPRAPVYVYGGTSGGGYYWTSARNGYVPRNAVVSHYRNGRPVFVCRANYRGTTYRGQLHSARGCNINYRGRTIVLRNYRVLMQR